MRNLYRVPRNVNGLSIDVVSVRGQTSLPQRRTQQGGYQRSAVGEDGISPRKSTQRLLREKQMFI